MAKEKFNEEDGVWRTIGGRRVFIKKGQSMADAMKESGKFKTGKKEEVKEDHTFEMTEEEEKEKNKKKENKALGKDLDDLGKEKMDGEGAKKLFDDGEKPKEPFSREKFVNDKEYRNQYLDKLDNETKEKAKAYWEKEDEQRKGKALGRGLDSLGKEELNEKAKENLFNAKDGNTNYRDKITDVAKNSKEDNVTLDVETGKPVSFEKGYSVSFQQSTDDYDDDEYAEKVRECREKCDGKVYAGKYGGDAEASFHTDSLDDAKEIMYKYNQESIWDWQHETLIMNDKYDASKNQTNYKEEKSTNEIMNDAIRQKAGKNKVKEDLPQKTEIKTQGTSNRKEVSENIQAHILDYYESPEAFLDQMDNMNAPTKWHAGEELAKGGNYMIYYDEQREFLDSLKINPKGKRFNDDRVFSTYTSLIGRESAKLYDRLTKNAYKKYLKEHPGSEMSLEDFKKMRKGE